MGKRVVKILITSLLVISLLSCSFSVFATDAVEVTQAKETLVAYYIWQFLNAIGIEVTYRDILEYNDYIQDTIIDWVINYIADEIEADSMPSNYTIAQWIAPWQVGYDYWGNLQYNDTMLEDMQDFAEWLKAKFSLIDDDSLVINPVYTVNGTYTLYSYNHYYYASYTNGGTNYGNYLAIEFETNSLSITPIGYVVVNLNGNYLMLGISNTSGLIRGLSYGVLSNGVEEVWGSYNVNCNTLNNNNYYTGYAGGAFHHDNVQGYFVPDEGVFFEGDAEAFSLFRQNLTVQTIGDIKVVTVTIEFPMDSPDYTPGDGMTIVDGQPTYEEITFSGEITNLPAIVSTGTVENPGIDQIYTNIPPLIEEAGNSMEIFRQIIFRMPDGVLIALYALLSAGVIFGFLRIMREH